MSLRVGDRLVGYCGSEFGDSHGGIRVEAVGADWVVARDERGTPLFASGDVVVEKLWECCPRNSDFRDPMEDESEYDMRSSDEMKVVDSESKQVDEPPLVSYGRGNVPVTE